MAYGSLPNPSAAARRPRKWIAAASFVGVGLIGTAVLALASCGSGEVSAHTSAGQQGNESGFDIDELLQQPSMTPEEIGAVANHLGAASYRFLPSVPVTIMDIEAGSAQAVGRINLDTGEWRAYGEAVEPGDTFHHGMLHYTGEETVTAVLDTDEMPVVEIPPNSLLVVGTFAKELRLGSSATNCQSSCPSEGYSACCHYSDPGSPPSCACIRNDIIGPGTCESGGENARHCALNKDEANGSYSCEVECDTDHAWACSEYGEDGRPICECTPTPGDCDAGGVGANSAGLTQKTGTD